MFRAAPKRGEAIAPQDFPLTYLLTSLPHALRWHVASLTREQQGDALHSIRSHCGANLPSLNFRTLCGGEQARPSEDDHGRLGQVRTSPTVSPTLGHNPFVYSHLGMLMPIAKDEHLQDTKVKSPTWYFACFRVDLSPMFLCTPSVPKYKMF